MLCTYFCAYFCTYYVFCMYYVAIMGLQDHPGRPSNLGPRAPQGTAVSRQASTGQWDSAETSRPWFQCPFLDKKHVFSILEFSFNHFFCPNKSPGQNISQSMPFLFSVIKYGPTCNTQSYSVALRVQKSSNTSEWLPGTSGNCCFFA